MASEWTEADVAPQHTYIVGGTPGIYTPTADETVRAFVSRVIHDKGYTNYSVTVDGTPIPPSDPVVSEPASEHDISIGPKEIAGNY